MKSHSAHWGVFNAERQDDQLVITPYARDPDPSPILQNFTNVLRHRARVEAPLVRKGWLERGPGPDPMRGKDTFVRVSWDEVLDKLAAELQRVKDESGLQSIFGGSYGWSSAGRFHHAQSQVHRFLNTAMGGYVRSVNSYSAAAAEVILPHVLGPMERVARHNVTWEQIAAQTDVVLAFGGMALKNSQTASGGVSQHIERGSMRAAAERGCRFVCVSPMHSDLPAEAKSEWLAPRPGTDTALMLALVYVLVSEGLHDQAFIERYCDGWATFEDYLLGRSDGVPKTPAWAEHICELPAQQIGQLARSLVGKRVLVVVAHSLQRSEHGEQPIWMGVVLAAALGQIGLPGGGYNYALGTLGHYGRRNNIVGPAALSQGVNGIKDFIPVARITDMLLKPGEAFDYNGQQHVYPHIRLAYWIGGNPFHHHQDLNRLAEGIRRLDTFVVHESAWTTTARFADIVLPATLTLEREDFAATATDPTLVAMHRVAPPYGEARDDYDIFCDLERRLENRQAYSEGRTAREWVAHLYERTRGAWQDKGFALPPFEEFWRMGQLTVPQADDDGGLLRAFRQDPGTSPLPTPSGKIQISSPVITGFGYSDCPGHPAWIPQEEEPNADHPLWLVANQPEGRLHSQLDFGAFSQSLKLQGREVGKMHPQAAAARGIRDGDIVRIFNARGACLAGMRLDSAMRPDVVRLPTGAWFDPVQDKDGRMMCVHGNPNVLTRDVGTSSLGQGCTGQLTAVQIERFDGELPPIRAFDPPG
ncbi:molybdopterin guanine dinucleotide-containing S/N-oxide reductase [Hydrogenophaga sp.]|uniref:molybdopterin guanine dinucleotide-containing S/N-oxide reductase n=1 Tax=Hydrogenophaga sp. TaxID=1904254 RepID=UPI00271B584C|nr:molybdopterin guanine dinucleotide-containing S/N-oxide reductase [Hydrogenophaga sp.]MDO9436684.1 molybdopterin guanine dinucleotide-containing S/N-oxide reductase [Hydrogenophaga sp.]